MWNVDQSYMTIILKLKICGTNRVTHEVFAECVKIRGMRDNHAKCVTGGNPTQCHSEFPHPVRIYRVVRFIFEVKFRLEYTVYSIHKKRNAHTKSVI